MIRTLLKERENQRPAQPERPETSEPWKERAAVMFFQESSSDEEDSRMENCVERYRSEPAIDIEGCPQRWWSKHEGSVSFWCHCLFVQKRTPVLKHG